MRGQSRREKLIEEYWLRKLKGARCQPLFLTEPSADGLRHGGYAEFSLDLPAEIKPRLTQAASDAPLDAFILLLTALRIALYRYTGAADLVLASAALSVDGVAPARPGPIFVRALVAEQSSAAQVRDAIRQEVAGLLPRQDFDAERLLEKYATLELGDARSLSQVGCYYDPANAAGAALSPPSVAFRVHEAAGSLRLRVRFDEQLRHKELIPLIARHFLEVAGRVLDDPTQTVGQLGALTGAERRWLLNCDPPTGYAAGDTTLTALFEEQMERTSDAAALVLDDTTNDDQHGTGEACLARTHHLTYAELNRRANQLAHHLRRLGVGPETLVALLMERSERLIVGILGVLKCGAAFVPIDPALPEDRIAFMLHDAQARVLVTNDQRRSTNDRTRGQGSGIRGRDAQASIPDPWPLTPDPWKTVNLDADWPLIARQPATAPESGAQAGNLAAVIYTSGTTGRPKGVLVEHRGLAHTLRASQAEFQFSGADVVACLAAFSFDIALFELFSPLLVGGACLLVAKADVLDLARLATLLERATTLHAVPSLMRRLLAFLRAGRPAERWLRMRLLFTGGDRVPPGLLSELRAAFPHARQYVLYGPTEGTIICARYRVPRTQPLRRAMIGRGFAGTTLRLYDARLRPVPPGVVGELYLGGAGVARGYLNRPELTAERFIPNPFTEESGVRSQESGVRRRTANDQRPTTNGESNHLVTLSPCHLVSQVGDRLYRTGDLARYLPDGTLEFVGRDDDQVKIRGFRVELGELESWLLRCDGVAGAAVVAAEDEDGEIELVAYVVPANDQRPTIMDEGRTTNDESIDSSFVVRRSSFVAGLRSFLAAHLPDYMLPARYVLLGALPLSPNGKVDRQALPRPDARHEVAQRVAYQAPRTPLEAALVAIWQEILQRDRVGVTDNFFELGGQSLKATRLAARIHQELRAQVSVRQLFDAPTIAGLASAISAAEPAQFAAITPVAQQHYYPLSHAQRRLWLLSQLEPGAGVAYNMAEAYLIEGKPDETLLRRALHALIARHESLRTTFAVHEGEPSQVIAGTPAFVLQIEDLSGADQQERLIEQRFAAEVFAPFDLERGPLIRARLLALDAERRVLLLALHHIAGDAWSARVLARDLTQAYAACARGAEQPLPALRIQYKDYAAWHRAYLASEQARRDHDYWHARLAGELPLLDLPADFARPPAKSYRGSWRHVRLAQATTARLRSFEQGQGVSLFMTLLALVKVLLYRYSGQNDLIVGTPVAGRNHVDLEDQIGFYVNTVALRDQVQAAEPFSALLARVKHTTIGAYDHANYPFDLLVDELRVPRDLSRNPLFDVQVAMQLDDAASRTGEQPGAAPFKLQPLKIDSGACVFDLTFSFLEGAAIDVTIEYSADLYQEATIARMAAQFVCLAESAAADPARPIRDLNLLPEVERRALLETFDGAAAPYPRDSTIVELFEAQAARIPDRTAVVYRDAHLTFGELNRQANRLAHQLRGEWRIGPEQIVAVVVDRSEAMVGTMLAVWKAGGAYLPITPDTPNERIAFMLRDSRARLVLAEPAYVARLRRLSEAGVAVCGRARTGLDEDPPAMTGAERLAYVIYTSGSTGVPKGVMVEHRSMISPLLWRARYYEFGAAASVLQSLPLSFDISISDILAPLLGGARLVIVEQERRLELDYLADRIRRHAITHIATVPSLYRELLAGWPRALRSLRMVTLGGEPTRRGLIAEHFARLPAARLLNEYGPTENSICTTIAAIQAADADASIGAPIPNQRIQIIDRDGSLAPIGVPGELCLSGPGLARGYLNQPDLTAARFIPNPFAAADERRTTNDEPEALVVRHSSFVRLYRTGDIGRWRADGTLEFIGRADGQVKIRGFRVELAEIERALERHPQVRQAAALARADSRGDPQLVAYVVTNREQGTGDREQKNVELATASLSPVTCHLSPTELRAFLAERLPTTMLPARIVRVDELPLNAHGKIDKRALAALADAEPSTDAANGAPQTVVEHALIAIWEQLLDRRPIGRDDNFFDLGGHSLTATRLVSWIAAELAVRIPLRAIFEHQTISQLAIVVAAMEVERYPAITLLPEQLHYELSHAQQRLWVLNSVAGRRSALNLSGAFVLREALDIAAFRRALEALAERHEALRTTFITVGGAPRQRIHRTVRISLAVCEPAERHHAAIDAQVQEVFHTPFELDTAPLFAVKLIRAGNDTWICAFAIHHIISDGASRAMFVRDLLALYAAQRDGRADPLPRLSVQYKEYAAWHNRRLQAEEGLKLQRYWRERLSGHLRALELPADFPRPGTRGYRGDTVDARFGAATTARLHDLGRAHGASLFMTLCAAIAALLYRWTGQEDIVLGFPVAGRQHPDLAGQIGCYINPIPLRIELSADQTLQSLLNLVKQTCLEAYEHQDYPFDRIVSDLRITRESSHSPLFDVGFTWDSSDPRAAFFAEEYQATATTATDDLWFFGKELDGSANIAIVYDVELFRRDTIEQVASALRKIVEAMVHDASASVSALDLDDELYRAEMDHTIATKYIF